MLSDVSGTRGYATQLAIRGADALRAGPGGRSSVTGVTATIFGCSGFVGRYISQSLGSLGTQLVLPYRCDDTDVQHLRTMGDLGMIVPLGDFDIRCDDQVKRAISQSQLVINLIGADQETWNYSFEEVHIDIPSRIAKLSKEAGVERLIHFSALGASSDAPSRRLRTKAAGEDAVRSEFGSEATIFKPTPITGTEDRLFNRYASWIKSLPFFPLINGGNQKIQPVWIRDVAQGVTNALHSYDSIGKTYHLAGPDVFTMEELVNFTYDTIRESPAMVPVPGTIAKALSGPAEWLAKRSPLRPDASITSDAIDELSVDFVAPAPGSKAAGNALSFEHLDVSPHKVYEGIPIEYLRHYRSGGYDFGNVLETTGGSAGGFRPPSVDRK